MRLERRPSPRYRIETPLEVYLSEGERFPGMTRDVSSGGVGLELGRAAVKALAQGGSVLTTGDRFRISMDLQPTGSGHVLVECRTTFVRRLAQDRYAVGAQFEHFESGEAPYEAFLTWCAAKSSPETP